VRSLRADARRNRALIVTTAAGMFAARGPEVSMEEIAQAAGLGVGTLYRHFPDRQALLEDIAADSLRRLLAAAETFAARPQPRWDVLLMLVQHCAGLPLALTRSLSETTSSRSEVLGLVNTLDTFLARLAEQAQQEGSMRADIAPRAVVDVLSVAVCRPGARADDALTTVILDGLRATSSVGDARGQYT
jgi:AcrR family transcriptional regulator